VHFAACAHATYVPDNLTRSNLERQFSHHHHHHPSPPFLRLTRPPLANRPGRSVSLLANERQSVWTDNK